jgi:hypothetical protein
VDESRRIPGTDRDTEREQLLHMPEDLAVAMGWKTEVGAGREEVVADPLLAVLHPYLPKGFDAIVAAFDGDRNAVRSGLLEAELRGEVRAWPGDQFTRTVR